MGQRKSQTPMYRHQERNRHESGRCKSNLRILPPKLEGQMLSWSQPDLWSEDGRGRMRGREVSGGGAAVVSLVNTRSSLPSESYPTELGNFQRQFLLTSQLSWASGPLIRLVNTIRTAGGRDPPMSPATGPLPSQTPPQHCFSLLQNICPCLLPLSVSLHWGLSMSPGLSPAACLCLAPL